MLSPDLAVRDVMQTTFVSLKPDMDIYEAVKLIIAKGLMGAPVVHDGALVGVFSEKDCFRVLANWTFQMSNETGGSVSNYMTKDVVTLEAATDLSSVVSKFLSHYYRGLPVVEEGKLVGLISRRDILRSMIQAEDAERTANYPDSKYGSNVPELG